MKLCPLADNLGQGGYPRRIPGDTMPTMQIDFRADEYSGDFLVSFGDSAPLRLKAVVDIIERAVHVQLPKLKAGDDRLALLHQCSDLDVKLAQAAYYVLGTSVDVVVSGYFRPEDARRSEHKTPAFTIPAFG
jgi:hypothetical protein